MSFLSLDKKKLIDKKARVSYLNPNILIIIIYSIAQQKTIG